MILFRFFVLSLIGVTSSYADDTCKKSSFWENKDGTTTIDFRMPHVHAKHHDDYLCSWEKVPNKDVDQYIVDYKPHLTMEKAHHMLFFGCNEKPKKKVWNCLMGKVCPGNQILYAWAKDAKELRLPKGIGFKIGKGTKINYLVTQIHYKKAMKPGETDCSGLTITTTTKRQPKLAGVYLVGQEKIRVPPHGTSTSAASCVDKVPDKLRVFAFATHAHERGRVLTAYRVRDGKTKMIGKGNPEWPLKFDRRVGGAITLRKGDDIIMRCDYKNNSNRVVNSGPNETDEMCNFYLVFWTYNQKQARTHFCWGNHLHPKFPKSASALAPYPGYGGIDSTEAILDHRAKRPKVPQRRGDDLEEDENLETNDKDVLENDSDPELDSELDEPFDKNNSNINEEEEVEESEMEKDLLSF